MLFRRRPKNPELVTAFDSVATALDRAQRALLAAIPTARHPGAPLLEALDEFEKGLDEVARLMPAWRTPATETLWETCEASLKNAQAEAARLRGRPPSPTEFEALNTRVGDVLAPLEDFTDAERALRTIA